MKRETFTLQDAKNTQMLQLLQWKKVLTQKVYFKLLRHAMKENEKCTEPYKIFRGTDIDQWIHNYMNNTK
jgi:hypothetical protein